MPEPVFFPPSRPYRLDEIADLTGARLADASRADLQISGIAAAADGREGAIVFLDGARNAALAASLKATAVFCTPRLAESVPSGVAVLITDRPALAFARVAAALFPNAFRATPLTGEPGVSPAAHISPEAILEAGVTVEAGAVIGPGAAIGAGTLVSANAVIGPACQIGRDCMIGPGASLQAALLGNRVIVHAGARLGQDGFGFVPGPAGLVKTPQIGRVVIQDDVEIGANTTIDRGALTDTIVGEGTKIDNLVQIAHNCRIGRHCVIAGQVGISGSVTIGDGVMLGGGVGISDHLTIGAGAQLAAGSGLMHDVPAGARWGGAPARPIKEAFRELAVLRRLAAERSRKEPDDG